MRSWNGARHRRQTRHGAIPARIIPGRIPAQEVERNDARTIRPGASAPPAARHPRAGARAAPAPPRIREYKAQPRPNAPGRDFSIFPRPDLQPGPPPAARLQLIIIYIIYHVYLSCFPVLSEFPRVFQDRPGTGTEARPDPKSIEPEAEPQPRPALQQTKHDTTTGNDDTTITRDPAPHPAPAPGSYTRPAPAPYIFPHVFIIYYIFISPFLFLFMFYTLYRKSTAREKARAYMHPGETGPRRRTRKPGRPRDVDPLRVKKGVRRGGILQVELDLRASYFRWHSSSPTSSCFKLSLSARAIGAVYKGTGRGGARYKKWMSPIAIFQAGVVG